jgi:hydroxysqualene dehydroxylase
VENLGRRVAIVGAGYAGMAAAVTLAGRGVPVTVFESGPVPGGRARRINAQGHELDNGQHILVGAYTTLFGLMRKVGVPSDALLRLPLELRYAAGFAFRALWFPAPIGLLAGLLLARGISLSDRIGAVRFMAAMRRQRFRLAADMPVNELLEQHGQNGKIGHYLWRPLCVSALNTPVDIASANIFLAALRDTLSGAPEASDLLLPRIDLSRLFPEPAAEFVAQHGGEIRLRATVQDVVSLKKDFSEVIVAVGPHQLKSVLPEAAPEYTYQPIYTCYLQYPASVRLPYPMLGLADGLVQWVFDRGALMGEKGRLACVISAQGDHQQLSQDELAERCHRELAQSLELPRPEWSQVIAEKRATITCSVNLRRMSPEMPGVHLAGDYTDAEYPPTLEAAVRSGVRAALKAARRSWPESAVRSASAAGRSRTAW